MNRKELLRKIKTKAKVDVKNRRDPRFLEAMGFLVAKGFLKAGFEVPLLPNKRLQIDRVVWAGKNVEPRILEVLPAAVLRLEKHFDLDPRRHPELAQIVEQLRRQDQEGLAFHGMPYGKIKQWVDFPLRDKRTKPMAEKKIVKTFRLDPKALERLKDQAKKRNCTETQVLERLLLGS